MMHHRVRQFVVAALLLPLPTAGCTASNNAAIEQSPTAQTAASPASPASDDQLKVVATFLPMYLFTKAVAGEAANVSVLIKPGTEVHDYQSTPTDVQTIAQADVVVKNGLGMEEFLDSTIQSAGNAKLKVVDASQGISAIKETSPIVGLGGEPAEHDHSHDHDHAHDNAKSGEKTGAKAHVHADGNPHVWLSPVLAKRQVENIRDGLIAADPDNKATYQANAAAYIQKLSDLDNQFEQTLKPFQDRTFITFHDAFPYLAKEYDLKQVAVVQLPEDQLTPSDVQKTVDTVKQYQVKALFSEPGVDNKLLTSLANDLNVTVRPLNSLESGQLDPQYYFSAMNQNLSTLQTAFK
jgi:zinc/manganese transport system substrate-binding protein